MVLTVKMIMTVEEVAVLGLFYNLCRWSVVGGGWGKSCYPRAKAVLIPTGVSDHEIYEGGIAKGVAKF